MGIVRSRTRPVFHEKSNLKKYPIEHNAVPIKKTSPEGLVLPCRRRRRLWSLYFVNNWYRLCWRSTRGSNRGRLNESVQHGHEKLMLLRAATTFIHLLLANLLTREPREYVNLSTFYAFVESVFRGFGDKAAPFA